MYQSKADHLSYLGSVYVSACVLSFTPLVVWSVTTPKITKRANAIVAEVREADVQRAVRIDVADAAGVRRIRRPKPPIPAL